MSRVYYFSYAVFCYGHAMPDIFMPFSLLLPPVLCYDVFHAMPRAALMLLSPLRFRHDYCLIRSQMRRRMPFFMLAQQTHTLHCRWRVAFVYAFDADAICDV